MTEKTFRFVRNHDVPAYERAGWIRHDSLTDTHHGFWSTLMELDEEAAMLRSAAADLGDEFVSREASSSKECAA
jgi:hypothetical protein